MNMDKCWSTVLAAIVGAFCALGPQTAAAQARPNLPQTPEAMVNAAKPEGTVTWYMSNGDNIGRRVSAAFKNKYGIAVSFVVLETPKMLQRFAAEFESGKPAADIMTASVTNEDISRMLKIGGVAPIDDFALPALKSGEYPATFNKGPGRLISAAPWLLGYNTQAVKAAEVPKDWKDLLNPRWKGRILLPDPGSSASYVAFWYAVMQQYGADFLKALRGQNMRVISSGVPAAQALGAGEGDVVVPTVPAIVLPLKAAGAPVDFTKVSGASTGTFVQVLMTRGDKTPHPNAARLFANFLLSKDGSMAFNADPGQVGSHNIAELPAGFSPPAPEALQHKDEIVNLLTGK